MKKTKTEQSPQSVGQTFELDGKIYKGTYWEAKKIFNETFANADFEEIPPFEYWVENTDMFQSPQSVGHEYKNMPDWNKDNFKTFRKWAEKCFDAGYETCKSESPKSVGSTYIGSNLMSFDKPTETETKAMNTPLPWSFEKYPMSYTIFSSAFGGICLCEHKGKHKKEHEANASLIVSAVNNTAGKGIDPEKVHILFNALKAIQYGIENKQINNIYQIAGLVDIALEDCVLK